MIIVRSTFASKTTQSIYTVSVVGVLLVTLNMTVSGANWLETILGTFRSLRLSRPCGGKTKKKGKEDEK